MEDVKTEYGAVAPLAPISHDIEREQTSTLLRAIGNSLPSDVITDLYEYFRDAEVHAPYKARANAGVRFIYEALYKDGWNRRVKELADAWVRNTSNIQRAAAQVGRQPEEGKELLRGFGAFRLKVLEVLDGEDWTGSLSLRMGLEEKEPQTVVYIALEDLDMTNGFFMELKRGHDVCLDSRLKLRFPKRTGNGIFIFIALNM